jgi:putative peptide zinc metalloprotease protein
VSAALADMALPPLREDLRLSAAAANHGGEPEWIIHDAVVNRFYRIGWLEFECLLRWGRTAGEIAAEICEQTALKPDVGQVLGFLRFLQSHQLLRPGADAVDRLRSRSEGARWLTWNWWLHHYLFFRIPLLRPQRFLRRIAPYFGWAFSPVAGSTVLGASILGLALVARQWDEFTSAIVDSFSAEGLLGFALALIVGKTLHEFAHALVATRLGLRVAHMGIAFVVLWPMLYTDTGEAWKLRRPGQRLAVAAAGIVSDLSLAGLSTLGWALCDPGALRNAFFYLATASWVLSLALNASPFTRFDGYFILSDLLDFPNLHERSSALARVCLRRTLLGLEEDWPEPVEARRRRLLIGFAITTWAYRLVLFLGIAVAVYLLFFKALGIFLFIVEVSWFVMLPIARELKHWWASRAAVPGRRRLVYLTGLTILLLFLAIPWQTRIHAYGVARAEQQLHVFAPYPARIQSIRPAGPVKAGDALAVLTQPDIAARMQSSEASIRGYEARLRGLLADPGGLAEAAATQGRLGVEVEETRAARSEIARLTLTAPFDGQWADLDPNWRAGQWIGVAQPIGILFQPDRWQVDAYVRQEDVHRLGAGGTAWFYPAGQVSPIRGRIIAIGSTRVGQLEYPMLAARFGGPLSTAAHSQALVPISPVFHVLVQLDAAPATGSEIRGQLQIHGGRRSLLAEGLTRLFSVLLRESGF